MSKLEELRAQYRELGVKITDLEKCKKISDLSIAKVNVFFTCGSTTTIWAQKLTQAQRLKETFLEILKEKEEGCMVSLKELQAEYKKLGTRINQLTKFERQMTWVRDLRSIHISGYPIDPDAIDGFTFAKAENVEKLKAVILEILETGHE